MGVLAFPDEQTHIAHKVFMGRWKKGIWWLVSLRLHSDVTPVYTRRFPRWRSSPDQKPGLCFHVGENVGTGLFLKKKKQRKKTSVVRNSRLRADWARCPVSTTAHVLVFPLGETVMVALISLTGKQCHPGVITLHSGTNLTYPEPSGGFVDSVREQPRPCRAVATLRNQAALKSVWNATFRTNQSSVQPSRNLMTPPAHHICGF